MMIFAVGRFCDEFKFGAYWGNGRKRAIMAHGPAYCSKPIVRQSHISQYFYDTLQKIKRTETRRGHKCTYYIYGMSIYYGMVHTLYENAVAVPYLSFMAR
jgi:hypothetical protein